MADNDMKEEYTGLTDTFIKFVIARLVVTVTVVVTLYNGVSSRDYRAIVSNYSKIKSLSDSSWGVPLTGDWFIDGMYLDHGMYKRDSLDGLLSAVATQIGKTTVDTSNVLTYKREQDSLLLINQEKLASLFKLKLSFISEEAINLQIWLFILPLLYILSNIYVFFLKKKMRLLELRLSKASMGNGIGLTFYDKYPNAFLVKAMFWAELILLSFFLITYYKILSDINAYFYYIVIGTLLAYYYSLAYSYSIYIRFEGRTEKSRLIIAWEYVASYISKIINRFQVRKLGISGISMVLITLLLSVSNKGCTKDDPMPGEEYHYYRSGKWHSYKNVSFDDTVVRIRGYELISNYPKKVWDFGYRGVAPNRFFQVSYIFAVINAILFAILSVLSRTKVPRLLIAKILSILFIFSCLPFVVFTVYLNKLPIQLEFQVVLIALIIVLWIINSELFFKKNEHDFYWQSGRVLLLLLLPFLPLLLKEYCRAIFFDIALIVPSIGLGINPIAIALNFVDFLAKFILHFGILCIMIALYRLNKELTLSKNNHKSEKISPNVQPNTVRQEK
ncbi:hypothetical protein [Pseudocnuella soli]|uniref:hypothetical protein n=1 Tax=Pseudocnuella soli TaxID=2502779 RepID=UPI001044E7A2|nr:hypothetical protein [Pseudocnuella soli]